MNDVRELLHSVDEQPVRLSYSKVLNGAARRERRRRAYVGGAAVAVVAILMAAVLTIGGRDNSEDPTMVAAGGTSTSVTVSSPSTSPPTQSTTGAPWSPTNTGWTALPGSPLGQRTFATVLSTGSELLIWGGEGPSESDLNDDGAVFDPANGSWRIMAPSPLSPRSEHAAVWTGNAMIVCCGRIDTGAPSAAMYDPTNDQWTELPSGPVADVEFAGAAWTGREMIVLGGSRGGGVEPNTVAAALDPEAGTWRQLAEPPVVIGRRPSVYWDGERLHVLSRSGRQDVHVSVDPASGDWSEPSRTPTLEGTMVGIGEQLFVWGADASDATRTVGVLASVGGVANWVETGAAPLPSVSATPGAEGSWSSVAFGDQVVVWTGSLVAGPGSGGPTPVLVYDVGEQAWASLPEAPVQLYAPSLVVVGDVIFAASTELLALSAVP